MRFFQSMVWVHKRTDRRSRWGHSGWCRGIFLTVFALMLGMGGGLRLARADDFAPAPPPAEVTPKELEDVGVEEHLGDTIPLDVRLRDEGGRDVRVGDFFVSGRPVVVNFVYHSCPMLCGMVLRGLTTGVREVPWTVGKEYEIITVSIDPHDTPAIAAAKKSKNLAVYGRGGEDAARDWHFLTGDDSEVHRLANALGFRYHYDAEQKQFAHSAALFVLTPKGKIARYLYGIEFAPRDLRLALAEAAEGRTISTYERLLLYCYHYDPSKRGYVVYAVNVMRLGGVLCVLALGGFLTVLWRRERHRDRLPGPDAPRPVT